MRRRILLPCAREDGVALVLMVIALPVILLLAGMVIDYSVKFHARQQLQKRADASALAGALDLPTFAVAKQNAARFYAMNLSVTNPPSQVSAPCAKGSSQDASCYSISDNSVSITTPYTKPSSSISPSNLIHVAASGSVDLFFARMIGIKSVRVSAAATAAGCQCNLGYPFASGNPLTSVDFNESEVLRAFGPNAVGRGGTIRIWYNDEHALTLGVRQIIVDGVVSDYNVTPMVANPDAAMNVQVGATAMSGDQSSADPVGRPMYPALFVTDITTSLNSRAGDWQYGGTPIAPTAVFGTWKAAVKTVTTSKGKTTVTVLPDDDPPAKNDWDLGPGSDPAPAGLDNEGFGAEVRWDVNDLIDRGIFQSGHIYRVQFMVHDGDQHKTGGDVGQNCAIVGVDTDCGGGLRD